MILTAFAATLLLAAPTAQPADLHVWEKTEVTLQAAHEYANPYTDVRVWVDLKGPGFARRCYGFWDGGRTFRVRVLATAPGRWTWSSGSQPDDSGLAEQHGSFQAAAWTAAEKEVNPCRRGMVRASDNGHAFQYADGTPFFLIGDTWWATPTFRFPWIADDQVHALGPKAGFQDYVEYRHSQQFNCIAMIAAFPNWADDGQPAQLKTPDGTVLRAAWPAAGTKRAKKMPNENGQRAFLFPGRVPGFENVFPDVDRLNPDYFKTLDRKVDYLNQRGMIPFIEVARRDVGQAWMKFYPWPESYVRYVEYVWNRYQANICFFSPIHFDTPAKSIPAEEWARAARRVMDEQGRPPFGTLIGTNANPSSLVNWGHVDKSPWLGFHQIGNRRTHDCYQYLTDIFRAEPPLPGINGEPYYDGMEDAAPGSSQAARYCRSAMYGSFLSGGLGGHIYGAGGWAGGIWSGEVEAKSKYPIWQAMQWPSAAQMQHLKAFVLSEGDRYQQLQPARDLVSPNNSGKDKGLDGWAFAARTPDKKLFMVYFERGCPVATISGAIKQRNYRAQWFEPKTGQTIRQTRVVADRDGKIQLTAFPDNTGTSTADWALKLVLIK